MYRYRRIAQIGLVLIAAALPNPAQAQSAESLAGTWKLNPAKSKYEPADLATKSGTATYAFKGNTGPIIRGRGRSTASQPPARMR